VLVVSCTPFGSAGAGKALLHVLTFFRLSNTTGVLRTGEELLTLSGDRRGGDRRNQVSLPERQSASSHAGS